MSFQYILTKVVVLNTAPRPCDWALNYCVTERTQNHPDPTTVPRALAGYWLVHWLSTCWVLSEHCLATVWGALSGAQSGAQYGATVWWCTVWSTVWGTLWCTAWCLPGALAGSCLAPGCPLGTAWCAGCGDGWALPGVLAGGAGWVLSGHSLGHSLGFTYGANSVCSRGAN